MTPLPTTGSRICDGIRDGCHAKIHGPDGLDRAIHGLPLEEEPRRDNEGRMMRGAARDVVPQVWGEGR